MSTTNDSMGLRGYTRTSVQIAALVFGAVFVLIGILGFIPGVTTNTDQLLFAGHDSEALLFGVFQVSILHNLVHLLYGIVGIALARRADWSRYYLIWGGAVYALLWLYGLFTAEESAANFVPVNTADNWLHFVLAVGMIGAGLVLSRDLRTRAATSMR
jgi:hypothetical protein